MSVFPAIAATCGPVCPLRAHLCISVRPVAGILRAREAASPGCVAKFLCDHGLQAVPLGRRGISVAPPVPGAVLL